MAVDGLLSSKALLPSTFCLWPLLLVFLYIFANHKKPGSFPFARLLLNNCLANGVAGGGAHLCGLGCYLNPCQARQTLVKIIFRCFITWAWSLLFLIHARHNLAIHGWGFTTNPHKQLQRGNVVSSSRCSWRQENGQAPFPSGKHGAPLVALKLEGEVKEACLSVYLDGSPPVLCAQLLQGSHINDLDRNRSFSSPFLAPFLLWLPIACIGDEKGCKEQYLIWLKEQSVHL